MAGASWRLAFLPGSPETTGGQLIIGPPLLWRKIAESEQCVAAAERQPKYLRLLTTATPGNALNFSSGPKGALAACPLRCASPPGAASPTSTRLFTFAI